MMITKGIAQIKFPIIAQLNKQYQLSQGNNIMTLNDVVQPMIDIAPYTKQLNNIFTNATGLSISSTGDKVGATVGVLIVKKCKLIAVSVIKLSGVFTSSHVGIFIISRESPGLQTYLNYSAHNLNIIPYVYDAKTEIILNPGDIIGFRTTIDAYTSTGNVYIEALIEEWKS